MSRKQKIIVSITGIVLVSLILIGLTYAYFLTVITGNTNTKSISVTTANLSLTYSDNSDVITGDKILPGTTLTPKTFTVTNNGNKNIDSYKVGLVNILNTFTRTGDIVYTLTCKSSVVNKTCNGVTEKEFPNLNSYIVENEIDKNEVQTYTLTVTYKEMGVDQSGDMNKELSAKIDIFDSNSLSIQGNVVNSASNDYVVIHSKEQISEIVNGKYKFIGIEPDNHTISIKNKNTTSVKNTTLEVTKQSDSSFNNNQINYSDTNKVADMDINIDGSNINLDITNLSDGIPTLRATILSSAKKGGEGRTVMGTTVTEFTSISGEDERVLNNAPDDYGTSYYFRGNVLDNYVSFADKIWRIVRINGDGSVRLVLDDVVGEGSPFNFTGTTSSTSSVHNKFKIELLPSNNKNNYDVKYTAPPVRTMYLIDNAYIGYMYGATGSTNYDDTHKNVNNSGAKTFIDSWYETYIQNSNDNTKQFESYLSDTLFCGDKSISSGNGYGYESTEYNGYTRNIPSNGTVSPSFECAKGENNDYSRYTSKLNTEIVTSKGISVNNDLTHPIALITADEMTFAGAYRGTNNNYYYFSNSNRFFTMTPAKGNRESSIFSFDYRYGNGLCTNKTDLGEMGYKPVVNLKNSVLVSTGDGTKNNPYTVKLS